MKKWLINGFVAFVVIATVVSAFMGIAIQSHDRAVAMLTAPTLDDLDALSERLAEGAPQETTQVSHSIPESSVEEDAEMISVALTALPSRLARTASPEMLDKRFSAWHNQSGAQFEDGVMKAITAASLVVSPKHAGGWVWERTQPLMSLGEWDEARRCFWLVLDAPLDRYFHRDAYAKLAWLEVDPEIAARYLALSAQGDEHGEWLANAYDLCRVTGSDALAEHYLAQLRIQNPEMARQYEGE